MKRLLHTVMLMLLASLHGMAQHTVVEETVTEVVCDDATHATTHYREVLTIMNEQGADNANFLCSCSKDERLTAFRCQVTNTAGATLRKFRQGDLKRTEYSEYLAIDDYKMFLEYTPPTYPVTITREWTIESRNTLIEFPWFCPQSGYDVSVRHARYQLTAPKDITIRHALQNIGQQPVVTTDDKGRQVLTLTLTDLPVIKEEPLARPLRERLPLAYFAPQAFVYYGTKGSLNSWHDYGLWEYELLKGRDALPATVKAELHQLTDGLPTARQKVEAVYGYLEQHTRYVAILLGIGGQQPAPAAEVAKTGFGDCKGLSNFMRAMLQEVGIAANYATISTRNRRLLPHFASVGQMNHVVVQVPLPGDTLWLECTNAQLPLGYVHADIAGHDAIVVSAEGGRLVRLPASADTANAVKSSIGISLDAQGAASIQLRQRACQRRYEQRLSLLKMDGKERKEAVLHLLNVQQATVEKADVSTTGACLTLEADVHSQRYATLTGGRLFVPVCPVRQDFSVPTMNGERTEPLVISAGFQNEEQVEIALPEGYQIEALPKDVAIEKPFGSFSMRVDKADGSITVTYHLLVRSGTFDKALYADFADFTRTVSKAYTQKAILTH